MKLNVRFSESKQTITPLFGEIHNISDGGFERGYTDGYAKGKEDGHAEGFETGAKSEHDLFWDTFQDNGNRTLYQHAFFGDSWTDTIFNPKYDIKSKGGAYDFANTFQRSHIADLAGILERNGVVLDTSLAPRLTETFQQCAKLTSMPPIDMGSCVDANRTFYNMNSLKKLDIRNLREDCVFAMTLSWTYLTELSITGTIGQSGLDIHWCNLPKDNFENIINVLSATASEKSITLSRSAINSAFETSAGAADGSASAEWIALINTKPNWTINLA